MPTYSCKTILLAIDCQNSVLSELDPTRPHVIAYTPYGDSPENNELQSRLRYNGELQEVLARNYSLGRGYRTYSPVLMRFISPDSNLFSPFGEGGLNAYAYCGGDPINNGDPTGHFKVPVILKRLWQPVKRAFKPARKSADEVIPVANAYSSPTSRKGSALSSSGSVSTSSRSSFSSGYESSTLDPGYGIGSSASLRKPNPMYTPINGLTYNKGLHASEKQSISEWLAASHNTPDKQLDAFTQIPRVGAELHTKERLAVQASGVRKGSELQRRATRDRQASALPAWLKF